MLLIEIFLVLAVMLTACKKESISPDGGIPGGGSAKPGNQNPGQNKPDSGYKVKVKATITIGDIMYDSIPASLQIATWDTNNVLHQQQVVLKSGANEISLPRTHIRYQLKLSKWGITDEMTFTKAQIQEGTLIGLGGTKAAKKLRLEEGYLLAAGSYRPDSKTIYSYDANGGIKEIAYYQKRPEHSDLKLYHSDVFVYSGKMVAKINRFDENGTKVGVTDFIYSAQQKVTNILQKMYDQQTGAAIEYSYSHAVGDIDIYYVFKNGNTMHYNMKFKSGNKIQDIATTSLGKTESGAYVYDFNINPFAHMNIPNLFLSNLSKNNMVGQQKSYSGDIPSGEPYNFEYSYDAEGYPTELVKSYKSYTTGEHLYKTKTIFTYQ